MVEVGDKVVCIKSDGFLTLNRVYTVASVEHCHNIKYTPSDYSLITLENYNVGMSHSYAVYFKLLTEIRNEKINKIKERMYASR